jgi:hypothetical protein
VLPVIVDGLDLDGGNRLEIDGAGLSNGSAGLRLASSHSTLSNLAINNFSGAGIAIDDGLGNSIRRVNMAGNTVPIDLGSDGPTENDAGDADEGPNRLMNAPAIVSAEESQGRFTVRYVVDATEGHAAYPLAIDFYSWDEDSGGLTWVAEDTLTQPADESSAVFFSPLRAGVTLVATATDAAGNTSEFGGEILTVVNSEPEDVPPLHLSLGPIFPNPVHRSGVIPIELAQEGHVRVVIFDLLGRAVSKLVDERMAAGRHRISWSPKDDHGSALGSGTYVVRLESGGETRTRTLLVVQ